MLSAARAFEPSFDTPIPAAVAAADQRSSTRIRTIRRAARLTTPAGSGLCRIHNISDGGALIEAEAELEVGEIVKITLAEGKYLRGRIAWHNGRRAGVRFLSPVDCCALLRELADTYWNDADRASRLRARGTAPVSPIGTLG